MSRVVRILHLEDDINDADLVRLSLKSDHLDCTIEHAATRDEFLAALDAGRFDIILSDFSLPGYDGFSALSTVRKAAPDTPFIFVSGAMGEEVAIDTLRLGATDYVLKDKLFQLVPAIERALVEAETRRERAAAETALRESEALLRTTLEHAPVVLYTIDRDGIFRLFTGAGITASRLETQGVVGQSIFERYADYPEAVEAARQALAGESFTRVLEIGAATYETSYSPIVDDDGAVTGAVGVSFEISERLRAERDILALNADLERRAYEARAAEQKTYVAQLETIERLAVAAEYKDEDTGAHIARVSHYALLIGRRLGLSTDELDTLMHAAPMHDVGKMGIPDRILLKPGKLDATEWEIVKQHSEIGGRILGGSSSELLQAGEIIALSHHEKWDGSGYPGGLAGEDIPLWGRIVAIADVFDALTSKRPYKDPFPFEKAIAIMREGHGTHFDPQLLDLFLSDLDKARSICER